MNSNIFLRCPESGLGIQIFRHEHPVSYPEHSHNEMAIVICTRGTIESTQFSCKELLQEDQVLVTNSGVPHASRYCVDGRATHGVTLELDPTVFERLGYPRSSAYLWSAFLGKLHMPAVCKVAHMIEDEVSASGSSNLLLIAALARQVIFLVMHEWPKVLVRKHEITRINHLPRNELVRSIDIMNATSAREFSVPSLARQLHRSTATFSRLFAHSMNVSPYSFFKSTRLQQAADLLSSTDRSIKDIALTLGFINISHFSASFHSRWHVSPTNFRKAVTAGLKM